MKLALAVLLISTAAFADRKADAEAAYKDGVQLYQAKEYLAAAAKFQTSYDLDPDPAVLFNIAQAYRLGHACTQAARSYHRFLDAVPNPPQRAQLDGYIEDMEACAKREERAVTLPVVPDIPVVPDRRAAPDTQVVPQRDPGRRLRTLGLVIGAVGVVGAGVGAYFTYDVKQLEADREDACPDCVWGKSLPSIEELDRKGRRAEILEVVMYASAGAALATGVTLYLLGARRGIDQLAAAPTRGGGSVSVGFSF